MVPVSSQMDEGGMSDMIRTFMAWTSVVVMAVAFLVYVGSAVLYLAPPNPLSLQSLPAIRAILHPFFSQNWHLFAPNPIRSNFVLTVRCRVNGQTSPWHDPFTPLQAQHHRHRFSPMGKVTRVPFNSMLIDRKSTRLNSSHIQKSRMPSSA